MERRRLYDCLSTLSVVIRLGLGCLFLWSSVSKIQLPHDFLGHVYAYRLAGPASGMFVSMMLPWLELLVGACLLAGVFVGGALLASLAPGPGLPVLVEQRLQDPSRSGCGCFSSSVAGKISYMTLIRAIGITLLSAAAYGATLLLPPKEWLPTVTRSKADTALQPRPVPNDSEFLLPQE
ncbi:MAG: hypothetical protein M1376_20390 [Planctomycetes bacterium]|nr:hypothetical protein [Planctomycetota bacterium]